MVAILKPAPRLDPRRSRRRATTIPARRRLPVFEPPPDEALFADRPKTRAECVAGPRPCPWVGCKHHLYLDVNPDSGSIKLNFPDLEPWELGASCALDVADQGGVTLEEVGQIMNLTRERIRQVEVRGLLTLKRATPDDVADCYGAAPVRRRRRDHEDADG